MAPWDSIFSRTAMTTALLAPNGHSPVRVFRAYRLSVTTRTESLREGLITDRANATDTISP